MKSILYTQQRRRHIKTIHVGQKTGERERARNKKEKNERKRQGNRRHFNQPYLSGFCVGLYMGALKVRRKKKLLLLLQLLVN